MKLYFDRTDCRDDVLDFASYPILLKPSVMEEVYKADFHDGKYQMVLCVGGNGSYHDHMGTGVFFMETDGQRNKWNRASVLGVPTQKAMETFLAMFGDSITSPDVKEIFEAYAKDPNWKPGN